MTDTTPLAYAFNSRSVNRSTKHVLAGPGRTACGYQAAAPMSAEQAESLPLCGGCSRLTEEQETTDATPSIGVPDFTREVRALFAELDRLRAVEAAAYGFADEMGDYCSPHGVAAMYAQRLRERLQQAGGTA